MTNIVEEIFDTILNLKLQLQQRDQIIAQLQQEIVKLKEVKKE